MTVRNHLLPVKKITDKQLMEFTKSPYRFYHRFRLKKRSAFQWRELVQLSVNRIVHDFYKLPQKSRSSLKVLELIQRHWVSQVNLYDSKIHYYTILAKVTDHLLQGLLSEREESQPLYLAEKVNTWNEELQITLSITFHLATWTNGSFVIKKYIVDDDPNAALSFNHLAILFCKTVFKVLPERIETVSLLSGRTAHIYPNKDDVREALDYCERMKNSLRTNSLEVL